MPTPKKIVIDGKVVDPINKQKLPPGTDWQALVLQKKAEAKAKEASE